MRWSLRNAVLAAVAYADVFDSPLTLEEIQLWLVYPPSVRKKITTDLSVSFIRRLNSMLTLQSSYVFLKGRAGLVPLRLERLHHSENKWQKAHKFVSLLRLIPTVQLVGVTGGLAMDNTNVNDDIDLFFVVSNGTIWLSRFLVILLADIAGARRTVMSTHVADKFCLNMFVTVRGMGISEKDQNLYTAHEVLQMKPIFDRHNTYSSFLKRNIWVKAYLPNAWHAKINEHTGLLRESTIQPDRWVLIRWVLKGLEQLTEFGQKYYMKSRRTTEVVTADVLQFHPHDAKLWVKPALRKRYKYLGLPLDKVFFDR